MSAKSRILRDMYGVEGRPKTAKSKYTFYRQQRDERYDVLRRAKREFDKVLRRKAEMEELSR
jgi:hypothetical protein